MRYTPTLVAAVLLAAQVLPVAAAQQPAAQAPEVLAADTPKTTAAGNSFVAPAGWTLTVKDRATILESPEGNTRVLIADLAAPDADAAVAAAWALAGGLKWPLIQKSDAPDRDGWTNIRRYDYQVPPAEKRVALAVARKANDLWTVMILDADQGVAEKRGAQFAVIGGRLLPKGRQRETFAGRAAKKLDEKAVAELARFVEDGRQQLGLPGVSIGIVQDGKVLFAGGFGRRDVDRPEKPDADTLYMIASNTKALTTLMLAKLVDEGKLAWDTPVTTPLPTFKLGDADTTKQVLVKHLICACTGLPRQDFEWLFQFEGSTPASAMATLGTMQPTSKFGELFQYSNPLAAAGGFVGGHVAYPDRELGAAYDEAMRAKVLAPLGMTATTFDFKRALAGNHAVAHSPDVDGKPAHAVMEVNYSIVPVRPAGGAWSSVNDMLKYVQMEIDEGLLPGGARYINRAPLLERRSPMVALGKDAVYGMGLMVDRTWGVPVVHHGGDMIGFHSDMLWLPEQKVGAVILTNGDSGVFLRGPFQRKLLELLFDGEPLADKDVASGAKRYREGLEAVRKLLTVPADPASSAALAARYGNAALGEIAVTRVGPKTVFDFGEWKSEVATRKEPDGSVTFVTISPGVEGFEFIPGARTLTVRDAQHEYVFAAR